NILWWFGHPVVYALLFPSAGFGYYMVERLTGGKIIGERLTKIAWFVAVAVQNIIGSHHVYQDLVNPLPVHVSQQILTYAITIPSLASLYVIIGTLYLRKFEWDISAKFLFLSILGWILAGLSGVVNATIFWNVYIHNTLWIVAHFHAMAILNIMMMLAAISYFLIRDYTGTELYNEKLARIGMWHIYIGVMGFVHMWFIQGIMGGIRRSMTSTPNLGLYTWLSIPFALAALIGFWLSVFVILKTIQNGKQNE
ncbi:MAG: cbb3-type cytochrome c oxidase subunit I, partial [Candidatus Heimdallarchaeota archaeon]|nr:cbb3-type cytochrome c oxidase subunit I [Candidatus Heimdallarchaeota archaeon]